MPTQVYECIEHGLFEVTTRIADDVPPISPCKHVYGSCHDRGHRPSEDHAHTMCYCGKPSPWTPSVPAGIKVVGGTGAGDRKFRER